MYIGIDLGTSSVKVILVDEAETVVGAASVPLVVSRPESGWSEQAPADWVAATFRAIDELARDHPAELSAVRGIGLSGQMHGATLLDAADMPLRGCILWNDMRAMEECAELERDCPELREIAANAAMPGFTAPKLLWVRRHEPDLFRRVRHVLLPKSYLRLVMTGERIEEMSDASGTLWLDVARRAWSEKLLAATGLGIGHMPALVEGTAPAGRLRPELAARWGMPSAPIFAGGAGDNAASAVALSAVMPGNAFISLGTSGVVWCTTDRLRANPDRYVHAFCHASPGLWHQMAVMLSAGESLAWWSRIVGMPEKELVRELSVGPWEASNIDFLPYLSGERTPFNASGLRAGFSGLGSESSRVDMTRAVLEGVSLALLDCLDAMREGGSHFESVAVVGGGSRVTAWVQLLASVLDTPMRRVKSGDLGAALGAARLGRVVITGELLQDLPAPAETDIFEPDQKLGERLRARRVGRTQLRELQLVRANMMPNKIEDERRGHI